MKGDGRRRKIREICGGAARWSPEYGAGTMQPMRPRHGNQIVWRRWQSRRRSVIRVMDKISIEMMIGSVRRRCDPLVCEIRRPREREAEMEGKGQVGREKGGGKSMG
jgi:hypothetical protein